MDEASALAALIHARLGSVRRALSHDADWKNWLALGAAERALAGDHEGRYWLELAQNARDALHEGGGGRAWFGVTETGIVVANDGAPFRVWDPAVLDAVCLLDRSTKADKAGYVGHKGIGLKSIILRGAGYAVRSRAESGTTHRVGFLRSVTWAAVKAATATLVSAGTLTQDVAIERLRDHSRTPLFPAPHALPSTGGHDADLLEDLLEDGSPRRGMPEGLGPEGLPCTLRAFRTTVHLPYSDGEWSAPVAQGSTADEEAWNELMSLRPEVLLTLGEFTEVHLVRIRQGVIVGAIRIDIDQGAERPLGTAGRGFTASDLAVRVRTFGETSKEAESAGDRAYVDFRAPFGVPKGDGTTEPSPIRAIVRVPGDGEAPRGAARQLALFYPIDHATAGLPYVLHAPFLVSPNRKELRRAPLNDQILETALALVAEGLADAASPGSPLASAMPWVMAPVASAASSDPQLLAFGQNLGELIRRTACVPTAAGHPATGGSLLFDPCRPRAFAVLEGRILDSRPSASCLAAFERLPGDAAVACATGVGLGALLTDRKTAVETARRLVAAFPDDGGLDVLAPRRSGNEWLGAIAAWIKILGDVGDEVAEAMSVGRLPLVPVEGLEGQSQRLVRLEPQSKDEGKLQRRSRVLLWQPKAGGKTDPTALPTPPDSLPVFLADSAIADDDVVVSVLRAHGVRWGTRQLERPRTLAEEVAKRLPEATVANEGKTELVGYLATLVELLTRSDRGEWPVAPYAHIDSKVIHAGVTGDAKSSAREALTFSRRLVRALLPTTTGAWLPAEDLAFPLAWADELAALAGGGDAASSQDGEPPGVRWARAVRAMDVVRRALPNAAPCVADPTDPVWVPALAILKRYIGTAPLPALARVLVSLGVAPGPVIKVRWAHWLAIAGDLPGAIDQTVARSWGVEGASGLPTELMPALADWRQSSWSSNNHPCLGKWHSPACPGRPGPDSRPPPPGAGEANTLALTWTWSAELIGRLESSCAAPLRAALAAVLPDLEPALRTSWNCVEYHSTSLQFRAMPSLLAAQLARLEIWPGWTADATASRLMCANDLVYASESPADAAKADTGWLRRAHPNDGDDSVGRRLATELGIVAPDELPIQKAWSLLTAHIESAMADASSALDVVQLALPPRNTQWVAAANLLLRRLLQATPSGLPDTTRFEWCARDLGRHPGWLLAKRGETYFAIRLRASKRGMAALLVAAVDNYRDPPHKALVRDRLVLVVDSGERRRFASLAAALGAPETPVPASPPFGGVADEANDAQAILAGLRTEVMERLPELLGVLARERSNPNADARTISARMAALRLHRDAGLHPASGVDAGHPPTLIVSREAVDSASGRGHPRASALARGLAQAVDAPTYERDFLWALTGDVDDVRARLEADGVDLGALITSVDELESARRQREEQALADFDALVPAAAAASDEAYTTSRAAHRAAVAKGVDASGRAGAWLRALLSAARLAEVPLADSLHAYRGVHLPTQGALVDLAAYQPGAADAILRIAGVAVATRLLAAEGAVFTHVQPELLGELARIRATDWWANAAFVTSAIPCPDGPAVGWSGEQWGTIATAALAELNRLSAAASEPAWLRALCTPGDITAIEAALADVLATERCEASSRQTAWFAAPLAGSEGVQPMAGTLSGSVVDAASRAGGAGGSPIGDPIRGEAAELACLRWLWQRFVALTPEDREKLISAVVARRKAPGVAWSTNAGATRAEEAEKQHTARLALAVDADIQTLIGPFRRLFDVSTERGPGFDLIDWEPWDGAGEELRLKRVEIKAVRNASVLSFRITTNEFHRARADGQSYYLRIVEVPDADLPIARIVREIRDPVVTLKMADLLVNCVRSGEASFTLT